MCKCERSHLCGLMHTLVADVMMMVLVLVAVAVVVIMVLVVSDSLRNSHSLEHKYYSHV